MDPYASPLVTPRQLSHFMIPGSMASGASSAAHFLPCFPSQQVAGEWGFENSATAEAFYRAQQKRLRSQKKQKQAQKYADPQARLKKLQSQVPCRSPAFGFQ